MQLKKGAMLVAVLAVFGTTSAIQQAQAAEPRHQAQITTEGQHRRLDPARAAKLDKFQIDTQALRKQIAIKEAEKQALIHARKPDIAAVKKTAGELFDVRETLADKAREAGIFPRPKAGGKAGGKAEQYAATPAQLVKFVLDSRELRRQIAIASAEQKALVRSSEADPQQVAQSAGNLFELRENLKQKAKEAGLPPRLWQGHTGGGQHHRAPSMRL